MRSNKPYVPLDPALIEQARQIDLLTYLRDCEPSNLVKVKGTTNVYCTAEHDSLKISNGKWYWWSRGFGGVSALDYLMKVRGFGFVESIEILTGRRCTAALKVLLQKDYEIVDAPPPVGKDVNDFLLSYLGIGQQKTYRERGDAR